MPRKYPSEIKCLQCGQTRYAAQYVSPARKYCSMECYSLARFKTAPLMTCAHCKVTKPVARRKEGGYGKPPSQRTYCSRACRNKAMSNGGFIDKAGYRVIRVGGREVYEHRHVMEQMLGRPLLPDETVHHRNGGRTDNRPENLELWDSRQPKGQRVEDKIDWAILYLEQHGYRVLLPADDYEAAIPLDGGA